MQNSIFPSYAQTVTSTHPNTMQKYLAISFTEPYNKFIIIFTL